MVQTLDISLQGVIQTSGIQHTNGIMLGGTSVTEVAPIMMNLKEVWTSHPSKGPRIQPCYFRFFSLPRELRDQIYYWLFYNDGPIHPSMLAPTSAHAAACYLGQLNPPKDRDCWPRPSLTVLLANKQIYEEALGQYYSQNAFASTIPPRSKDIRERKHYITTIELWIDEPEKYVEEALAYILQLRKLKMVRVIVVKNVFGFKEESYLTTRKAEGYLEALRQKEVKVSLHCPDIEAGQGFYPQEALDQAQSTINALEDRINVR